MAWLAFCLLHLAIGAYTRGTVLRRYASAEWSILSIQA